MTNQRIAGVAYLKVDGRQYETQGEFTINRGHPMREGVIGTNRVVGFRETPQIPSIEGSLTLTPELSLVFVTNIRDSVVTVEAPNGAQFVLRDAYFAGEGTYSTEDGSIAARFEGSRMEEITA